MPDIQNKRKWIVNPKLLDSDNMSINAIKHCKVEAMKTVTQPQTQPKPFTSQWVSVEVVKDNDMCCHNAGTPTNPNIILESANDEDGIYSGQKNHSSVGHFGKDYIIVFEKKWLN